MSCVATGHVRSMEQWYYRQGNNNKKLSLQNDINNIALNKHVSNIYLASTFV